MTLALPPIRVTPAGHVLAGAFRLVPSRPDWRRRRCYWRALDAAGKPVTDWLPTPRFALVSAHLKTAGKPRESTPPRG